MCQWPWHWSPISLAHCPRPGGELTGGLKRLSSDYSWFAVTVSPPWVIYLSAAFNHFYLWLRIRPFHHWGKCVFNSTLIHLSLNVPKLTERESWSKWSFMKQDLNFLKHYLIQETLCMHNVPERYKTVITSNLKAVTVSAFRKSHFFHLQLQGKWTESCSKHSLSLVLQECENKSVAISLYLCFGGFAVPPL